MSKPLFTVHTFPLPGASKCACVIAGYRGKVSGYAAVIRTLHAKGYSVVAYEHSPAVLTTGEPQKLLDLLEGLYADFGTRSAGFNDIICTGASIGAGLGLAIQARFPAVRFGIYAGAGVSPPEAIFDAPLFFFVRRRFMGHGFRRAELKKAWRDADIVATKPLVKTPFSMALGQRDKITNYHKALGTLHAWQEQGRTIQITTQPALGHQGIIRWYKKHFSELLSTMESTEKVESIKNE